MATPSSPSSASAASAVPVSIPIGVTAAAAPAPPPNPPLNRALLVIDGYYLKKMSNRKMFELNLGDGIRFDFARFTEYMENCIQTGFAEKYYLDSLPEPVPKNNLRFLTALKVLGFQCPRFSYKKKKVFCPSQDCTHHRNAFEIDVQAGVDVGIAVKILERGVFGPKHIDTIVLVSGDGDFVSAIETAQQHQKNLWLFSFKSSLSAELRSHFGAQYVDCCRPEIFERLCSTASGDALIENESAFEVDAKNDDPLIWNSWSEHESADGRRYWYNHITYRSTWKKPMRPGSRPPSPAMTPRSPRPPANVNTMPVTPARTHSPRYSSHAYGSPPPGMMYVPVGSALSSNPNSNNNNNNNNSSSSSSDNPLAVQAPLTSSRQDRHGSHHPDRLHVDHHHDSLNVPNAGAGNTN